MKSNAYYLGFRITGVESNVCSFSFPPTFPVIYKRQAAPEREARAVHFLGFLPQKQAREREHFALGLGGLQVVILSNVSNYP